MGFNYAKEKAEFDREWVKLRLEYENAGMDESSIQQMYEFDLQFFCGRRNYAIHTQRLPEAFTAGTDESEQSSLMRKFNSLRESFDESNFPERFAWVETLEDQRLLSRIARLDEKDLELLTFCAIEGHTQKELAEKWGCSQNAINKRFKKIKKILKKGC